MDRRTWTNEQLIEAVSDSISKADVLRKLGLAVRPGNYRTFDKYVEKLSLDCSHFLGQAHGTSIPPQKRELKEVLVENSTYYSTSHLKNRLLKEGLLENTCVKCPVENTWQGERLVLVLDHINGDSRDNRMENLQLLCPNCNSQQPTFCRGKR